MHDLARLGVDRWIVHLRLQFGEHLKGRPRELRAEHERLQARDDRVPPEHAHEPGHAGAGKLADARYCLGSESGAINESVLAEADGVAPSPSVPAVKDPAKGLRIASLRYEGSI